jgi:LEA14-like dessication related protein
MQNTERILWYRILSIMLIVSSLNSCAPLKPLAFKSVSDLSIKNVLTSPEASVNLNLHNPNSFGGKIKDMNLQFFMGNVLLSNIQVSKVTHIPSKQDFTIPITGITSVSELVKFLPAGINSFLSGKDIPVFVTGKVTIKKFLFMKVIPFEFKDNINSKDIQLN